MSISGIYNFYCIKTIAKPFYRIINHNSGIHNNINFSNSDFELKGNIMKNDKNILSQFKIQYKKYKFFERYLYDPHHINYDLTVFKDNKFDNKLQIARDIWAKEKIEIMNTDPWISLSVENQETLNYLYNILEIKSNED